MYKPAPVRPTKTNISRSRNGCQNCRQKRYKCDEQKPSCSICARLGRTCVFNQKPFQFRTVTFPPNEQFSTPEKSGQLRRSNHLAEASISTEKGGLNSLLVLPVFAGKDVDQTSLVTPLPMNLKDSYSSEASYRLRRCNLRLNENGNAIPRDELGAVSSYESNREHDQANPSHRLILDFSLSSTRAHSERYLIYTTHWEKYCLPALSPIFAQLSTHMGQFPILRDAILSLSACHMSRTLPELQNSDGSDDLDFTYRPHLIHHMHSQAYYISAIRSLSRLTAAKYHQDILNILAAMLLFCYMESSICNFSGYHCHVKGISSLLEADMENVSIKPSGNELLAIWEQSRYYNWWIRIHFSTLNFQRNQSALLISLPINCMKESRSTRRAIILSILCESYRLSCKAFLQWWNDQTSPGLIDGHSTYDEDYRSLLFKESEKLDKWISKLDVSELPIDAFYKDISNTWTQIDVHSTVEHLPFYSHEASINFAYYAAARIMQYFSLDLEWDSNIRFSHGHDSAENSYWLSLLLRVVVGIKKSDCIRQNVYTIGISGLLLACILRSTNLAAGLWIETWLKEFHQDQVFEEGGLPIAQIIAIVSMINQQRRAGYDIFTISPVLEDDGGSGKFNSYNNQTLSNVLVFGRCRPMGRAFSSCVSVKDNSKYK